MPDLIKPALACHVLDTGYLIRGHPDVVPTKVGNHLKDWVPVFTGNPGFPALAGNDDYHPMNENVIPVKTGIQRGLSLILILRIAQFRL